MILPTKDSAVQKFTQLVERLMNKKSFTGKRIIMKR